MKTGLMFSGLGILFVILGDAMDAANYHHTIGVVVVGVGALLVILGTLLLSGASKGSGKSTTYASPASVPS
jgi:hypothetical protein